MAQFWTIRCDRCGREERSNTTLTMTEWTLALVKGYNRSVTEKLRGFNFCKGVCDKEIEALLRLGETQK